jgi:flagellar protein FlaJ
VHRLFCDESLALYYGVILFILSGILIIMIPPVVDHTFSFNGLMIGI